ncbi:MAG: hypothetical protein HZC17_03255 [Candidatus Omnitrophica bacterium]|nr:hypothetical protein [Candidatus Omnitrophota bacterium]
MKTTRTVFGIILFAYIFFGSIPVSQAGTGYEVKCADAKCGFKTQAQIGGGFVFEEAGGFCAKCDQWVSVTWNRGEKAPVPFATFWDPKMGEICRLYPCPKCKQPFVVIETIEDMKFCPKCNKPTLQNKRTVLYD